MLTFSLFCTLLSVIAGFIATDHLLEENSKKRLGNWLANSHFFNKKKPDYKGDPILFINSSFIAFFGESHFSAKCFARSAFLTFLLSFCFRLILDINSSLPQILKEDYLQSIPHFIIGTIYEALFFDWISLFITRSILQRLVDSSAKQKISYALFDIAIAAGISFLGVVFKFYFVSFQSDALPKIEGAYPVLKEAIVHSKSFEKSLVLFKESITISGHNTDGQWVYSTFSTTLWVYFYYLSIFLLKSLNKLGIIRYRIMKHINIIDHPMLGISKMLYALAAVFALVALISYSLI